MATVLCLINPQVVLVKPWYSLGLAIGDHSTEVHIHGNVFVAIQEWPRDGGDHKGRFHCIIMSLAHAKVFTYLLMLVSLTR